MSMFYCEVHHEIEDSDEVGFGVVRGMKVCDDALYDLHELADDDEVQEFNPSSSLFVDEDISVLDDPYFDLHTFDGPF